MHDLDKDNRIDGTEILKALTHDHDHETVKVQSIGPGISIDNEDEMITMIDAVLVDLDLNADGYIDYSEYLKKQNRQK
uniref:EF-hand domain-containing protein n=1 Tax=Heterorhabditis bacteriophora TaxID=37862 RepID=A0A1I7XI18_HETBA